MEQGNNGKHKNESIVQASKEQAASSAETEFLGDDDIPPEIKKVMEASFMMQRITGPMYPPFADKIKEEHISRILDITERENELAYKDAQQNKWILLAIVTMFTICFVGMSVFFVNHNKDSLMQDMMKIALSFIGGFGGGYWFKTHFDNK